MEVTKRSGSREGVSFDKITQRLSALCNNVHQPYAEKPAYGYFKSSQRVKDRSPRVTGAPLLHADPVKVVQRVSNSLYDQVTTEEIDILTAEIAESLKTIHPDYGVLAARIIVSNLHKGTPATLRESVKLLGKRWDKALYDRIMSDDSLCDTLEAAMDHSKSYAIDYFAAKTLTKGYLLSKGGRPAERPQHMWMRVALFIHGPNDLERVLETYTLLSEGYFTHASPTLFNARTSRPQLASCFLVGTEDSIEGIYQTLKKCALLSKWGGGIGVHIHSIRSDGSPIEGTGGDSTGIVPMLQNFNSLARYVNQGGKRKGSITIYLEPWHADIFDFLELRKNSGKEEMRCRDLFTALWVPDLFIKRVEEDGMWSLFDPNKAPGLPDCYGAQFEKLYASYEATPGLASRVVRAKAVWSAMLTAQVEGGTPYVLFKDAVNRKSNQRHLGTIKSSNLCAEVTEYTSNEEIAVCSLASLALPQFVTVTKDGKVFFDMAKLREVTKVVIKNLDLSIDKTFYPIPEAAHSNKLHRPLGLGVQGLADVFMMLRLPLSSPEARVLNRAIFQSIYYAAVEASVDLAEEFGPYSSFKGSPSSEGLLQFDLW
ncbi:Ribonucleotide reductase [Klebsormidium nitens]|uniref:Ribonucleoside-diphosphate reductase n=1 Tax=Klebsormidium nitens TaxID=105231 RepID=A0A1Y1IR82_KLENI|nr:Ribonucleotide reductase [Klebsormidium nitens]|eukprot:GAQ91761.1 Ribonucleotide reductase [Klebsormidium nitens]